jgi:hypothetical protein
MSDEQLAKPIPERYVARARDAQRAVEQGRFMTVAGFEIIQQLEQLGAAESRVRELEQALEAYFDCEIHEYGDDPERNYCQCGWAKNNPVHCVSALQGTDKAAKNG